jgi:hypothetical protein
VNNTAVTVDGIVELQKALPDCSISFEDPGMVVP